MFGISSHVLRQFGQIYVHKYCDRSFGGVISAILCLEFQITFDYFEKCVQGGWVDTHHFAEEGGELAQVVLIFLKLLSNLLRWCETL